MRPSFSELLSRSWEHMLDVLFRPFDIGKWFVLGFAAWLAGLTSWNSGGGSGGPNSGVRVERDVGGFDDMAESLAGAVEYFFTNIWVLVLVTFVALVIIAVLVLLTWISSRGKFIFLDGVVRNDAQIREPWARYREAGDSLFGFRLVFGLAQLVVGLFFAAAFVWVLLAEFGHAKSLSLALIPSLLGLGGLAMLFFLAIIAVNFALDAFVVPIMYRTGLPVMVAWGEFWTLFSAQAGGFILCALLVFLLAILVAAAIIAIGFMTCCVGFLLLMLPYIGTVLMLPILVTYRTFTALFLAGVEPRFDVFSSESLPMSGQVTEA